MNTLVMQKRSFRAFAGIFLALVMVLAMFVPVQAATKTLKAGTYATYKSKTDADVYYKVTIPSDGLVTVAKSHAGSVAVYAKASKNSTQYAYVYSTDAKSTFALAKGTYYFKASNSYTKLSDGNYYYYHKFKYTFKAVKPGSNYSLSRATALKAGKTVNIIQTRLNNYSRWYKVSLTKNQKLNFWTNNSGYIEIYNKNFIEQPTSRVAEGRYATDSKLAKGTYYIRVNPASSSWIKNYTALRVTLKWK